MVFVPYLQGIWRQLDRFVKEFPLQQGRIRDNADIAAFCNPGCPVNVIAWLSVLDGCFRELCENFINR